MTHKIISVKPLEKFNLLVSFQNGTEKRYDICSLFSVFPQFKIFKKDEKLFNKVQVDVGGYGISWNDDLDLDANEIWENGISVGKKEMDIMSQLAETLIMARETISITQKQLAEKTGIYQADISKIERGLANPSLSTLKRLADGLDMELQILFLSK